MQDETRSDEVDRYVTPPVAAEITGIPYATIDTWLHNMIDPLPHIRNGRARRVRIEAVMEYAKKRERMNV